MSISSSSQYSEDSDGCGQELELPPEIDRVLLTPKPIQDLFTELSSCSTLAPAFTSLTDASAALSAFSQEDKNMQTLWTTMADLNESVFEVLREVRGLFRSARAFYVHNEEELTTHDFQVLNEVTLEKTAVLRKQDSYLELSKFALSARLHAERASHILAEESLPIMIHLEGQVIDLKATYMARTSRPRNHSWAWLMRKKAKKNGVSITEQTLNLLQELSEAFMVGEEGLRRLSPFLDHMAAHFRDLSHLRLSDVDALGYKDFIDFRRFYLDRLVCSFKLLEMYAVLLPTYEAFCGISNSKEEVSNPRKVVMRTTI